MTLKKINRETKIFLLFSFLTLVLRLLTLMEINTGGDNIDYWYYGKALLNNYPYGDLFHRSIRWGILFPIVVIQFIFGTGAWVIYLIPVLMSLVLNCVVYKLAKYLFSAKNALISVIIIQLFPYTIRIGSQLFLAMFSITYLLISLYFLLRFFDLKSDDKKYKLYFLLSVLFMFIAYETKVTNLYLFVPWLILMFKKTTLKNIILYCSILAGLYLIEHFFYWRAGFPLGRMQIILSTHFGSGSMTLGEGVQFDGTFLGLFERYSFKNFPIYWHLITWLGIFSGFYLIKKGNREKTVSLLLIIIIVFMFMQTFFIKSINPVVPMEDFVVRYFSPLLPIFAMLIAEVLLRLLKISEKVIISIFILPIAGLLFMGMFLDFLPGSASKYLNNPLKPQESHLLKTIRFEKEVNDNFENGGAFGTYLENEEYTLGRRLSHKSLDTVNRLFLKLENGIGSYPGINTILDSGKEFLYLDIPGTKDSEEILISYRLPFELVLTEYDEVK